MIANVKERVSKVVLLVSTFLVVNAYKVYAITVPDEEEVDEVATKGVKVFFGFLAGAAVLAGGMEIYGAFMAYRENKAMGGFGVSNNEVRNKVIGGIMCFLAAGIIYMVMRWVLGLYSLG